MRRTCAETLGVTIRLALLPPLLAIALALPLATACGRTPRPEAAAAAQATRYRCPMHHDVVSDHPGNCPICRMELVAFVPEAAPPAATRAASATAAPQGAPGERKVMYWYDPMQPAVHFDHPGKSPSMNMELVPRYADETPAPATDGTVLTLPLEAVRAAGVATAPAAERELARTLHLVGTLEIDETRRVRIASRVAGRIERLYLDFVGQSVRRGAPIYDIWSPELETGAGELRLALANRERARASGDASYAADAEALVVAAEQRLLRFGAEPEDVAALAHGGDVHPRLRVRAPIAGTVLEKTVLAGQYVSEGQDLYQLADLSRVWLVARVYEADLGDVRVGQEVEARVAALPGVGLRGRVAFVDPVLDPATRTARARIELANDGRLLPGMFADADLAIALGRRLAVPKSAVLDTGTRRLVWVARSETTFEPRTVEVGALAGDWLEIRSGLAAGDRVVSAAGFLVDAQAQLQTGTALQWSGALSPKAEAASDGREGSEGRHP